MRHRVFLILWLASLPAAGEELLPFNQAGRAVSAVVKPAVSVDQGVYVRFAQQARGLNAANRASLQAQFNARRVAAAATQDTARAEHYARLVAILQSISGP